MESHSESEELSDDLNHHMYVGSIIRDSVQPSSFIDRGEDVQLKRKGNFNKLEMNESLPLVYEEDEYKDVIEGHCDIILTTGDSESTEVQLLAQLRPAIDHALRLTEQAQEQSVQSPNNDKLMLSQYKSVQLQGTHQTSTCVRAQCKAQPALSALEYINLSHNSKIGDSLPSLFEVLLQKDWDMLSTLHACAVASTGVDQTVCTGKKLDPALQSDKTRQFTERCPLLVDIRGCGVPKDVYEHILAIEEKCTWLYVVGDQKETESHPCYKQNKLTYQRIMNCFTGVPALHAFPIEGCNCITDLGHAAQDSMALKACLCTLVSSPHASAFTSGLLKTVSVPQKCVCLAAYEVKVAGYVFIGEGLGIAFPPLSSYYSSTWCKNIQTMHEQNIIYLTEKMGMTIQERQTLFQQQLGKTLKSTNPDLQELAAIGPQLQVEWQHQCSSQFRLTDELNVGSDSASVQLLYQTCSAALPLLYCRITHTNMQYGQASSMSPMHARFSAVNMAYATELAACQMQLSATSRATDVLRTLLATHLQQLTVLATVGQNTVIHESNCDAKTPHNKPYRNEEILDEHGHLLSLASYSVHSHVCACRELDLAPIHKTTQQILDAEFSRAHVSAIWLDQVMTPGVSLPSLPCPPCILLDGQHSFLQTTHLLVSSRTVTLPQRLQTTCCVAKQEKTSISARKYAQTVALNLLICSLAFPLPSDAPTPLLGPLLQGVAGLIQDLCDAQYLPVLDMQCNSPEALSMSSFLASPPRSRSGSTSSPAPSIPALCASLLSTTHSLTKVGNSLAAITPAIPFIPIYAALSHAYFLDATLSLPLCLSTTLARDPTLLDLALSKRAIMPLPHIQLMLHFFDQAALYTRLVAEFITSPVLITPVCVVLLKYMHSSNTAPPIFPAYAPFTATPALKTVQLQLRDPVDTVYQVSSVIDQQKLPTIDSASFFTAVPFTRDPTSLSFFLTGDLRETASITDVPAPLWNSVTAHDIITLPIANGGVPVSPQTLSFLLNSYAALLPALQTSGSCLSRLKVLSFSSEMELLLHQLAKIYIERAYCSIMKGQYGALHRPAEAVSLQTHYPDCQQMVTSWVDSVVQAHTYQSLLSKTASKLRMGTVHKYTVSPAILCHVYQLVRVTLQDAYRHSLPMHMNPVMPVDTGSTEYPDLFQHVQGHLNGLVASSATVYSQLSALCIGMTDVAHAVSIFTTTPLAYKPSMEDLNTLLHALPSDISLSEEEETDGIEWSRLLNISMLDQSAVVPMGLHSPLLRPSPRLTSFSPSSLDIVHGSAFANIVGSQSEEAKLAMTPLFEQKAVQSPLLSSLDTSLDISLMTQEPAPLTTLLATDTKAYILVSFLDAFLAASVTNCVLDKSACRNLSVTLEKLNVRMCACKKRCSCDISVDTIQALVHALPSGSLCVKTNPPVIPTVSAPSMIASNLALQIPTMEEACQTLAHLLIKDVSQVFLRAMEIIPSRTWLENKPAVKDGVEHSNATSTLLELIDEVQSRCLTHLPSKYTAPTGIACICQATNTWLPEQTVMHTILGSVVKTAKFAKYISSKCCNCVNPKPVSPVSTHVVPLFLPAYLQDCAKDCLFEAVEKSVCLAYLLKFTEIPSNTGTSWFSRRRAGSVHDDLSNAAVKIHNRLREEASVMDSYFSTVRETPNAQYTGYSGHFLRQSAALIENIINVTTQENHILPLLAAFYQDLLDCNYTEAFSTYEKLTLLLQYTDRLLRIALVTREERQALLEKLVSMHEDHNFTSKELAAITKENMHMSKFK